MLGLIKLIFCLVFDLFRSRATLEAEILVLRQEIIVLRRGRVGRLPFSASDKLVLGWVCGLCPNTCDALAIIRPDRRECLDHVVVFGERHLRHLLLSYVNYWAPRTMFDFDA